jgi:hypothetical protein
MGLNANVRNFVDVVPDRAAGVEYRFFEVVRRKSTNAVTNGRQAVAEICDVELNLAIFVKNLLAGRQLLYPRQFARGTIAPL